MKYYIEAYDKDNNQVLGNCDGQGIIKATNYKKTLHYKALRNFQTLDNSVKFYKIVIESNNDYKTIEIIYNNTFVN